MIQLDCGTLVASGITVVTGAALAGWGTVQGAITNSSGGRIAVGSGTLTETNSSITNSGQINIATGNALNVSAAGATITNNSGGTITVGGGTLSATWSRASRIINSSGGTITGPGGALTAAATRGITQAAV